MLSRIETFLATYPHTLDGLSTLATLGAVLVAMWGLRASGRQFRLVAKAELRWGRLITSDTVVRSGRRESDDLFITVSNRSSFPLTLRLTSLEFRYLFSGGSFFVPDGQFFAEKSRQIPPLSQTTVHYATTQKIYGFFQALSWWKRITGRWVLNVDPGASINLRVPWRLRLKLLSLKQSQPLDEGI